VGLTPGQKTSIAQLFTPFILHEDDILGRDDLNNLLSLHSDVEHTYYKLWISSTAVLQKILHSGIYNQSAFELEEIRKRVRLYVPNDSFPKAIDILNEHRYIIISGIPGIGKTTLARMLVPYLLSNGYEEFVYLNDSIDDGYRFFSPEKKQVFFFDDFLGSNFFDKRSMMNQDNRIVRFIQQIKSSPNKVLILTTREYILSVARNSMEGFKVNNIEIAKCILDVSSYTNLIKAQILYNHLFFAEVPANHLADLLRKDNYFSLVRHPNFNPRIIEAAINNRFWEHCAAHDFSQTLLSYFDNPESVWLYIFENSLDKLAQYTLLVYLSMTKTIFLSDLEAAVGAFMEANGYKALIGYDTIQFNRSIREIENTFIKTFKDGKGDIIVEFQNPSIFDFLFNYLKDKNELIKSILRGAIFREQFTQLFTPVGEKYKPAIIILNNTHIEIYANRLITQYDSIRDCSIYDHPFNRYDDYGEEIYYNYEAAYNGGYYSYLSHDDESWNSNRAMGKYEFLHRLYGFSPHNTLLKGFVHKKFQDCIYIDTNECTDYMKLLKAIGPKNLLINEQKILECYLEKASSFEEIFHFADFMYMFRATFYNLIKAPFWNDKIKKTVEKTIKDLDEYNIHGVPRQVKAMERLYGISFGDLVEELEDQENEFLFGDDGWIPNLHSPMHELPKPKGETEQQAIHNIFKSLLQKDAGSDPD